MVIKTDMVTTRIMATIIPMRSMTTGRTTTRTRPMAMITAPPTTPTPDTIIRTRSMTIRTPSMTIRTPIMATIIMTTVTTMAMATLMGRFPKSCV